MIAKIQPEPQRRAADPNKADMMPKANVGIVHILGSGLNVCADVKWHLTVELSGARAGV
jgi:hypothetical protein